MNRRRSFLLVTVGAAMLCAQPASYAGPGSGVREGNWVISPFVGLEGIYDSNVFLAEENEQNDIFFEGTIGVDFSRKAEWLTVESQILGVRRVYTDFDERDFTSFGEKINVRYRRPGRTYFALDQRYRRVEDRDVSGYTSDPNEASSATAVANLLTAAERTRRDLHNAGVTVGKDITDKVDARATYAFGTVNYGSDGLFDSVEQMAVVEGGYRVTEKTMGTLAVQYGIENSDAFDDTTESAAIRVGAASRGTEKVQYKVGLGWQTYMRSKGEDVNGLSANLAATWRATEKVLFEVGGRNDRSASSIYEENVRTVSSLWLGTVYQPVVTVQLQLTGSYGQEKHADPVDIGGVMTTRKDDFLDVDARVSYTVRAKFLSIFAQVNYATVDSNVAGYDELRAGAGVSLQY